MNEALIGKEVEFPMTDSDKKTVKVRGTVKAFHQVEGMTLCSFNEYKFRVNAMIIEKVKVETTNEDPPKVEEKPEPEKT